MTEPRLPGARACASSSRRILTFAPNTNASAWTERMLIAPRQSSSSISDCIHLNRWWLPKGVDHDPDSYFIQCISVMGRVWIPGAASPCENDGPRHVAVTVGHCPECFIAARVGDQP